MNTRFTIKTFVIDFYRKSYENNFEQIVLKQVYHAPVQEIKNFRSPEFFGENESEKNYMFS